MIIQTGLRTDIPAFYAEWLINRLEAGFVCVRNPYHPCSVTRYRLSPEVVDAIGFCTKNPAPMLPHLNRLAPYGQFWYVTVTPYGPDIEPYVPDKAQVLESVRRLALAVGPDAVGWRYDPIFLSETYTVERHLAAFEDMAAFLEGSTRICVISFIDLYQKVRRNFPEAREVPAKQRLLLGREMARIARKHGMRLKACAEGKELEQFGVDCIGCMTVEVYEAALGKKLNAPRPKPARSQCGCLLTRDIGQYDTCGHLCRYCYANASAEAVRKNRALHDPKSPFLVGGARPDDQVHDAVQKKWADEQISLF